MAAGSAAIWLPDTAQGALAVGRRTVRGRTPSSVSSDLQASTPSGKAFNLFPATGETHKLQKSSVTCPARGDQTIARVGAAPHTCLRG